MKFFKKLDDYLLHFHPSIWVTRVHYFLPIGLGVIILLFLANIAIGWDPKDNRPEGEWVVFMLVIPVLVYLVYWFVFQSRYNVSKSGGKLTVFQEYLNFFLYACVFSVAYGVILVIPFSNEQKLMYAVSYDEVMEDIKNLNEGNALVNWEGDVTELSNNKYRVRMSDFVGNYYYDEYYYEDEYYTDNETIILTKREVLQRIEDYKASYNKYSENMITQS